ncbi:hypothetical protein [Parasulfitobacter algicola]
MTLTKTRMQDGIWEGLLQSPGDPPRLSVTFLDSPVDGVEILPCDEGFLVRIPIPRQAISDGVQTIVISVADSGLVLDHIPLMAGDPQAHDIRAEVDLLRAELDVLKRAFRRHCKETM